MQWHSSQTNTGRGKWNRPVTANSAKCTETVWTAVNRRVHWLKYNLWIFGRPQRMCCAKYDINTYAIHIWLTICAQLLLLLCCVVELNVARDSASWDRNINVLSSNSNRTFMMPSMSRPTFRTINAFIANVIHRLNTWKCDKMIMFTTDIQSLDDI